MTALRTGARRVGVLLPVALAVAAAGLLAGGPSGPDAGAAGDRYRAGERASERVALPEPAAARARERALAHARALGVPTGVAARAARVVDRFAGTTFDEIVTTDSRGRRLGIIRVDARGRLAMAVRLGWRDPGRGRIDAAAARARAAALATAAGLPARGSPLVGSTADSGWRVSWLRIVDGVPAIGDGTTVSLFADGTFHAAATQERALAAAPARLIERNAAEGIARERLASLLGPSADEARIAGLRLAWVAPNDTFDAAAPDAPDPVLRLAWVVEVRTATPLAERLRALELYLDAGDGSLLGGDLLR
jgi:hypothetical protein